MNERNEDGSYANPMRQQADDINHEALESTQRMRRMAEDTREVGAETLKNLDDQGQKLDHINDDLNKMRANVKEGEDQLHQMEKCCGCCVCPWNRPPSVKTEYAGKWGDSTRGTSAATNATISSHNNRGQTKERGEFKKVFEDDDKETEMEENLDAVTDILGDLKAQATAMNDELVRQDGVLTTIDGKMDANDARVQAATARTGRLIEKN